MRWKRIPCFRPRFGQELIDNFIAIKREEVRIVSEKSDEENSSAYYLHYI